MLRIQLEIQALEKLKLRSRNKDEIIIFCDNITEKMMENIEEFKNVELEKPFLLKLKLSSSILINQLILRPKEIWKTLLQRGIWKVSSSALIQLWRMKNDLKDKDDFYYSVWVFIRLLFLFLAHLDPSAKSELIQVISQISSGSMQWEDNECIFYRVRIKFIHLDILTLQILRDVCDLLPHYDGRQVKLISAEIFKLYFQASHLGLIKQNSEVWSYPKTLQTSLDYLDLRAERSISTLSQQIAYDVNWDLMPPGELSKIFRSEKCIEDIDTPFTGALQLLFNYFQYGKDETDVHLDPCQFWIVNSSRRIIYYLLLLLSSQLKVLDMQSYSSNPILEDYTSQIQASLTPLLVLLTSISSKSNEIRICIKNQLLPGGAMPRDKPLYLGMDIWSIMIRQLLDPSARSALLNNHRIQTASNSPKVSSEVSQTIAQLVGDLLWAICSSDSKIFVRDVGYGVGANVLLRYAGITSLSSFNQSDIVSNGPKYDKKEMQEFEDIPSNWESILSEKKLQFDIMSASFVKEQTNSKPLTAESEHFPFDSEEEKIAETKKLLDLFERLEKNGLIKPVFK